MLDREEAIVLNGLINDYKDKLESIMESNDLDLLLSIQKQIQLRLQIKENLTFKKIKIFI